MCQKEAEGMYEKAGSDRSLYDVPTAASWQLRSADTPTSCPESSHVPHSEKIRNLVNSSLAPSQPRQLLTPHATPDFKIREGKEKEIYDPDEPEPPLLCTSISGMGETWVTFPSPISSNWSGSSFDGREETKERQTKQCSFLLEDVSGHYMPYRELNRSLGKSTISNSSEILPYYDLPTPTPTLWDDDFGNSVLYRRGLLSDQRSPLNQSSFQDREQSSSSATGTSDIFCILVWDEDSTNKKDTETDFLKEGQVPLPSSTAASPNTLFLPQKQFGQYLVVPSRPLSELDSELALRLQRETYGSDRPDSPWPSLQESPIRAATPQLTFECRVCYEREPVTIRISLWECGHNFCKPCLSAYAKSRIEDNRYPIFCPECLSEYSRVTRTRITEGVMGELGLSELNLNRLKQLQLLAHSVSLECPKCQETMNVEKRTFTTQNIIVCRDLKCGHKWCNNCMKDVTKPEDHRCKTGNIDKLMKRKGWKYCPGCRTPVQKSNGCNHITCGAPGCNVHFCYRCGSMMIDTSDGGDVGAAVTEHYFNCKMFEKRMKCSIQ